MHPVLGRDLVPALVLGEGPNRDQDPGGDLVQSQGPGLGREIEAAGIKDGQDLGQNLDRQIRSVVVTDQLRNQGLVLDLDPDQALNLLVEKKIHLIIKIRQVTKTHHNQKKKLQMKQMILGKGLSLDLDLAQDPDLRI